MEGASLNGRVAVLAGYPVEAGEKVKLVPDVVIVSDVVSKGCLDGVQKAFDPGKVEIVIEHGLPSVFEVSDHHRDMVRFASSHHTEFNHGKGISYYELAKRKQKGENINVVVTCGSRTPMLGIVGMIGIQVNQETMREVLQNGVVTYIVPDTIHICLEGQLHPGVSMRDAAMKLVADKGNLLSGKNVELSGAIETVSMEEALEFTNYLTAAGVVMAWKSEVRKEVQMSFDLESVCPMVALPGDMTNIIPLSDMNKEVPFRLAFIGGCGGGSIEDIRIAARYLKGNQVAYGMRFVVSPADSDTYLQAAREGLLRDLMEAGAVFMNPGCLSCTGISCGRLGKHEVSLSTGSYNTPGCCGEESAEVYLASAETVAKGCLSGIISKELGVR